MRRWLTHSPTLQALGLMALMVLAATLMRHAGVGLLALLGL